MRDTFGTKGQLAVNGASYTVYRLAKAGANVERLPLSLRVLLENLLRHEDGRVVKRAHTSSVTTGARAFRGSRSATPPGVLRQGRT